MLLQRRGVIDILLILIYPFYRKNNREGPSPSRVFEAKTRHAAHNETYIVVACQPGIFHVKVDNVTLMTRTGVAFFEIVSLLLGFSFFDNLNLFIHCQ
jgi:hypothetical protein